MFDLTNPRWILVHRMGAVPGWSHRKLGRVHQYACTLIGNIEHRLIEEFLHWPWPLRLLRDHAVPVALRQEIKTNLANSCRQCRDELLTDPFFERVGGRAGIEAMGEDHEELVAIDHMFGRAKPSNQLSEILFARMGSSTTYRAGSYLKSGVFFARHVIGRK